MLSLYKLAKDYLSLLSRGAWIEIHVGVLPENDTESLLSRGAWIEMPKY